MIRKNRRRRPTRVEALILEHIASCEQRDVRQRKVELTVQALADEIVTASRPAGLEFPANAAALREIVPEIFPEFTRSERTLDVLARLLAIPFPTRAEIALWLGMDEQTVKSHLGKLYRILDAQSAHGVLHEFYRRLLRRPRS